jgi:hypothetical protein
MGEWFELSPGLVNHIAKQSEKGQTPEEFIAEKVGYEDEPLGQTKKQ